MAIIRKLLNRSPRKKVAPKVAKIGVVNPSAVISAMGIRLIAKNHNMTPPLWIRPLSPWKPSRWGFNERTPIPVSDGKIRIMPKQYRINAA
jgi:hypothetical protein